VDIDISNDSVDPVDDGFDINKVSYCWWWFWNSYTVFCIVLSTESNLCKISP